MGIDLNLKTNKLLKEKVINYMQEILGSESNKYKLYKSTSKLDKLTKMSGNGDPFFLLWLFYEDLIVFEYWCKKVVNSYDLPLYEIIEKIKKSKKFNDEITNYDEFIKLLHNIREFRNQLLHWDGDSSKIMNLPVIDKAYKKREECGKCEKYKKCEECGKYEKIFAIGLESLLIFLAFRNPLEDIENMFWMGV